MARKLRYELVTVGSSVSNANRSIDIGLVWQRLIPDSSNSEGLPRTDRPRPGQDHEQVLAADIVIDVESGIAVFKVIKRILQNRLYA